MNEAAVITVKLIGNADVSSSPDAQLTANLCRDELGEQLATTLVAFVSIMTKVSGLEVARYKVQLDHNDVVEKIRKEAKMVEDNTVSDRGGALFFYHGVLWSTRSIAKGC